MSKRAKTLPIIVNRRGAKRVIDVRRESEAEIMQECLNRGKKIRLRVSLQIANTVGDYYGWHGTACSRECRSIKEAREFERQLRAFVTTLGDAESR